MTISCDPFERLLAMRKEHPWSETRLNGLLPLVTRVKPKSVLEIGSFEGFSAEVFSLHGAPVVSVDPWPDWMEDVYQACLCRMKPYEWWLPVRGESPGALMTLSGRAFDLVYIDGDHSEAAVRADIQAVRRLVAPGGWIGGHDYAGPDTPGVKPAVDDLLGLPAHLFPDSNFLCGPYT